MRISRYLTASEFCKEAGVLKISHAQMREPVLERLERQRSLIPSLRLHYPDEIERRWWAQAHPEFAVSFPQEPDGQRWEDANALEQARQRSRWIDVDPRIMPLALDDPEPRFLPFIEKPSDLPFVRWEDYRVALNDSEEGPIFTNETVVTYYSSWQLLQFAEVVNMGVMCFINLMGTTSWPTEEDILAAPKSLCWPTVHSLRSFDDHGPALDAIVWFAEEFSQGHHFATRQDFSRRMLIESEIADIAALREWAAGAACERHGVNLDALTDTVRFLCEQWCEWHRMGRPLIADAYKLFAAQGIKLATIKDSLTVEEFSERLGRVDGYFKPITQVIWPDWASEQRDDARRVLESYNGERSRLQAEFSGDLIERFLDFIDAQGLHGFYWRFESFNRHAFKGNEYSIEALKGDVQGMALVVEHLASALGAKRTQLNQKFKELWISDPPVLKLLNDNAVMKIGNGKTIDLDWFEARNGLSLPEQTAADLAITYSIRGGAHRVIEETNPMKLERMMLILLRAAVKTFDAATIRGRIEATEQHKGLNPADKPSVSLRVGVKLCVVRHVERPGDCIEFSPHRGGIGRVH